MPACFVTSNANIVDLAEKIVKRISDGCSNLTIYSVAPSLFGNPFVGISSLIPNLSNLRALRFSDVVGLERGAFKSANLENLL